MRVVKPSATIETEIDGDVILQRIERAGRNCYKSEDKITPETARKFVRMILDRGHESVIEHESVTVRFIVDRGVTHEIVRHRLASYSQESTRYCNYSKEKFGKEITFIDPKPHMTEDEYHRWVDAMDEAESAYFSLLEMGAKPEMARSVLPNSLKSEIVVTMNLRELRHFFKLRTAKAAHPQMREVVIPLFKEMKEKIPIIFDDIEVEE